MSEKKKEESPKTAVAPAREVTKLPKKPGKKKRIFKVSTLHH